jgi:hypothetical protein
MTAIRLALVLGVVVLAGMCLLVAIGFTPMIGPLATVALLLLLVGGGNLLSGRRTARTGRPPPEPRSGP